VKSEVKTGVSPLDSQQMSKKILTIGLELASDATEDGEFGSKTSLLDWDIVLFKPDIGSFVSWSDTYKGKPSLSDDRSFQLKEACEHWRREIKQAVEAGKTVVAFLAPVEEVYIDTGERQYSGTGRNQRTTRIVSNMTNYSALPATLTPVNSTGSAMKLTPSGAQILSPLWAEFGPHFEYKVVLGIEGKRAAITTKIGDKPVGAILRSTNSAGALVLLPDMDFCPNGFVRDQGQTQVWTAEAKKFASRMMTALVALDRALHSTAQVTPEPNWAGEPVYALAAERELRSALLDAETKVEKAQKRKEAIAQQLKDSGKLRALLYESGKALENAIIDGVRMLSFTAHPYKNADSEFDVVFASPEGRFLGEAEGKDNKAINVDKLRQLAMNIHEDLQREDVTSPAKGVLFGNGYRLISPGERDSQFTAKCVTAAESSNVALVATTNLFVAVQYLEVVPLVRTVFPLR